MGDLARNREDLNKVITHRPDMLKAAGSLVTNQVRAYDLLRTCATASAAPSTRHTGTGWRTSSVRSAWSSPPACSGEIRDEDIARLSPLKHRNLNLLGRYSFALRPLGDPDAPELDEDDDGGGGQE